MSSLIHIHSVNKILTAVCSECELKPWYKQLIIMCYEGAVVNTGAGKCLLKAHIHYAVLKLRWAEFERHLVCEISIGMTVTTQIQKVPQSMNNLWHKMLGLNNLWILDYEIMKSKYEEQMTSQRVFELEWCVAWVDSWNELQNMTTSCKPLRMYHCSSRHLLWNLEIGL